MNIAICDDEPEELEGIREMTELWAERHGLSVQIHEFERGEVLLNTIFDGKSYDLFILDVLMPETNGIDLGIRLRKSRRVGRDVPVIYLTSSPEYAVDSYEVRAFHYLIKPVTYDKFDRVLTDATESVRRNKEEVILVRTKDGTYPVSYSEICYMSLSGRAIHYICADRELSGLTISGSFKSATAVFETDDRFFRCGASILVNLDRIKMIDKNLVTFIGGLQLAVPRAAAKPLYQAWLDHWLD